MSEKIINGKKWNIICAFGAFIGANGKTTLFASSMKELEKKIANVK